MINDSLLQFGATPHEYVSMTGDNDKVSHFFYEPSEYQPILPRYVVSRCPICFKEYTELLDTHTLKGWGSPEAGDCVFIEESERCNHFMLVHHFINLNKITPVVSKTELNGHKHFHTEQPHVMPMLFSDKMDCRAVMHSLPICRIEDDKFVPRYSLYMITYYASPQFHETLLDSIRDFNSGRHGMGLVTWPSYTDPDSDMWWDLPYWVLQGKLLWLEPDNPALPLIGDTLEQFPYENISGRRYPYAIDIPEWPLTGRNL